MQNDLKKWQEYFLGFLVSLGLLFFLLIGYNTIVFDNKGETTNSKVVRLFFKYLDAKLGKEYVFIFIIIVMIIFGIAAIRSYRSEKEE